MFSSCSFFHLSFFLSSLFSFGPMETLPSLTFRPSLGFRFDSAPQATYGPFGVSSSFRGRGATLCNIPCSDCGALFS
jgi:hypothetical protein